MNAKKLLAIVLALAMALSMTVSAFAFLEEGEVNEPTESENNMAENNENNENNEIPEENQNENEGENEGESSEDEGESHSKDAPAPEAKGETKPRDLSLPLIFGQAADGKGFIIRAAGKGVKLAEDDLKKLGDVLVDYQKLAEGDFTAKLEDGKIALELSDAFKSALAGGRHMVNIIVDGFNYGSALDVPFA